MVDVAVAAAVHISHGGGHGIEIAREESHGDGIAADHKDLTLGVERDQHPRPGSLPDFGPRQCLAAQRSRRHRDDESRALGHRSRQAGQFSRRTSEFHLAEEGEWAGGWSSKRPQASPGSPTDSSECVHQNSITRATGRSAVSISIGGHD